MKFVYAHPANESFSINYASASFDNCASTNTETDPYYTYCPSVVLQEKTKCEYCGGFTKDDYRGNCIACGAPKGK